MSKSFALSGGDLAIQGGAYRTVSGKDKLIQDMRSWILEPLGSDPATPTFGSTFEGVVTDTEEISGVIGSVLTQELMAELRAELFDMIERYQTLQVAKMQDEVVRYQGQTTLDADEVVQSIDSIEAVADGTTIIIRVILRTLTDNLFRLTIPIQR